MSTPKNAPVGRIEHLLEPIAREVKRTLWNEGSKLPEDLLGLMVTIACDPRMLAYPDWKKPYDQFFHAHFDASLRTLCEARRCFLKQVYHQNGKVNMEGCVRLFFQSEGYQRLRSKLHREPNASDIIAVLAESGLNVSKEAVRKAKNYLHRKSGAGADRTKKS